MKLLEVKNNLVKLSYEDAESPALGRFLAISGINRSYVAQFINLKSDNMQNLAIAKLLFTFTGDGIVDNYDGSIPESGSGLTLLPSSDILNILPVETPIKFGNLAQQRDILNLDISVFEGNLCVFADYEQNMETFISNSIRQLFQNRQKVVIIDPDFLFDKYSKITLGEDFKLPLNSDVIDYFVEYELSDIDVKSKAVVQDILYEVQGYIKHLPSEFLSIDMLINVVSTQYKESKMPELAILKNKLLKYKDAGIFANSEDDMKVVDEKLSNNECVIIGLNSVNELLQKRAISFIHSRLDKLQRYTYLFTILNDYNSDKKLLKELLDNTHVLTTIISGHDYKYIKELKAHAENMVIFPSQVEQTAFASYKTFLSKMSESECIVVGKLTQMIPFIVESSNVELDLTNEDVFGDTKQFVPSSEYTSAIDESEQLLNSPTPDLIYRKENKPAISETVEKDSVQDLSQLSSDSSFEYESSEPETYVDGLKNMNQNEYESLNAENVIEPVANILEDSYDGEIYETDNPQIIGEENLSELTEDDLDYIEETQPVDTTEAEYVDGESADVPIYPAETQMGMEDEDSDIGFAKGDKVSHPKYGTGTIEKIIKYGNKTLCSILFEEVGRRLLDPSISEFVKI